jgi:hypothetical protein
MKKCWRGKEKAMFDYSKNGSTSMAASQNQKKKRQEKNF